MPWRRAESDEGREWALHTPQLLVAVQFASPDPILTAFPPCGYAGQAYSHSQLGNFSLRFLVCVPLTFHGQFVLCRGSGAQKSAEGSATTIRPIKI